ncbi:killer cell lectin-like receptor subfamily B member 1B allele B [Alexandromys fortis]|uniref:killer cell lectin-like receptor subfamily B member 1B allele B n=1 Tax=Alexandromys fortis TaxID=100897 RepID=UPI002153943D|nr:killer cell lectin-like receptor subfamily B member 1B allele B [Microtus fortis]
MDASVVYADLNLARTQEPKQASLPAPPPDSCRCPRWHRLALKLSCVGLILLVLTVIGLGVLGKGVQENKTKATVEKCNVNVSESSTKATGNFDFLILINITLPFIKAHIMAGLMFEKMEA